METVEPSARFRNLRVVKAPIPRRLRTAWISDVHLGTRTSNAAALLNFLRDYELETLYVVGDLIDGWQMQRRIAAIVRYAERHAVEAVLCGHIHSPGIRQIAVVTYYNCGDWVESCSALVENFDGEMELLSFCPHALAASGSAAQAKPAGMLL